MSSNMPGVLSACVFFGLLIWGPAQELGPYWWMIRTLYLVLGPLLAGIVLKWIWRAWRPSKSAEDRFQRTLAGAFAGAFWVGAVLATQTTHHFECTQSVWTRDGSDCVGDLVAVPGPNYGGAFLWGLVGLLAFAYGLAPEPWERDYDDVGPSRVPPE